MTRGEKKRLITTNALIWAVGMVVSFIAPLIVESIVDGRGEFLKMAAHVFPLVIAMQASTGVINKAIGEPAE